MKGWGTGLGVATVSAMALAQATGLQTASAQETPQAVETANAVRSFDPPYFARFNPVTAQDMVRQIPGFSIDNGSSLRGFGATAGNVLIDGQRPSSKTSVSEELARIPARDVARIELIGAAAAGNIDVRGYTEIANVVLKPASEMQVSSTYQALVGLAGQRLGGRIAGSRTWKTQDLTVRLNAQLTQQTPRIETDITISDAMGDLVRTREEFGQQNFGELLINGTVNWAPTARDLVNVTGRVMPRLYSLDSASITRNPAGAVTGSFSDAYEEEDIWYFDLGGDWEHKFAPGNSLKLVLVNSYVGWNPRELYEEFNAAADPTGLTRNNSDNERGEHVLRGVWTLKPTASHTVEIGAEGAFNYRDTDRSVAFDGGSGFMPVDLPFASIRVEEERAEVFVTDTWRINPKLTLESGFTQEISTIRTIAPTAGGDEEAENDYSYPKPRMVASWTPTTVDQFRLSHERKVSQLDFSLFSSSLKLVEDQLTIGNPLIEPQQLWETSLQWKRSIGDRGSVSFALTYEDVDDVLDLLPQRSTSDDCISDPNGPGCLFTAAGNIGDGERWSGLIEATLPLDAVGVKGGRFKVYVSARDSMVADPFTGAERRFTNDVNLDWNIDFRQDLPELKLAWGGDYSDVGDYKAFRLTEEQTQSAGPGDLDLFIETTYFKGLTVRLAADNIGDQPRYLDRRFYAPNRFPGGAFSGRELRESTGGPSYTLSVAGSF